MRLNTRRQTHGTTSERDGEPEATLQQHAGAAAVPVAVVPLTRYLPGVVFRLLIDWQCAKSQIIKLELFQPLANSATAAAAAAATAAGRRRCRVCLGHAGRVAVRLQVRRSIGVHGAHSLHCVYVDRMGCSALQMRDRNGRADARDREQQSLRCAACARCACVCLPGACARVGAASVQQQGGEGERCDNATVGWT